MVQPPADPTAEFTHHDAGRSDGAGWFGHPRQLARLFTIEMWERFGYYGLQALLTLYLAKHFLFGDAAANGLYSAFTSLVYLTPLFGGLIADRILGSKRSVKFGAILMSLGYFLLCFGGEPAKPYLEYQGQRYTISVKAEGDHSRRAVVTPAGSYPLTTHEDGSLSLAKTDGKLLPQTLAAGSFETGAERSSGWVALMLLALSAITVGNGFFKPNISTIVGTLYAPGDRRRDSGFTIFYMGINIGAFVSQTICPLLAVWFGWWVGFLFAALGMALAWALVQFDGGKLDGYGEPPADASSRHALYVYVGAVACIPLAWFLFDNMMTNADAAATAAKAGTGVIAYLASLPILGKLLFGTWTAAVVLIPLWAWRTGSREEFHRMVVAAALCAFSVAFWTLYGQAGSSLTFFADRNTDRSVLGIYTMPAAQVQVFNPLFIMAFAPVLGAFWTTLAKRGRDPSVPVKFAIGMITTGLGFLGLVLGTHFAGPNFQTPLIWVAFTYLLYSLGELCVSPVGLSMITKLSIARITGLMMGVWFLTTAVSQYVAGIVAQFASVATVGGEVANPRVSLETYAGVFQTVGLVSVAAGGILLIAAPLLRRGMHGVR